MQNVSTSDIELLNAESPISLHLYIEGTAQTYDIIKATYKQNVASGEEFSIGNVCASSVEMTLDATDLLLLGTTAKVTYSVNEAEYTLIEGFVDESKQSGYETTIKVYDYLYTKGNLSYTVPSSWKTSCTLNTIMSACATYTGLVWESASLSMANNQAIYTGNLQASYTITELLSMVGLLLGGNVIINRSGKLEVKRFTSITFSDDPYDDSVDANSEAFSITGVTCTRTDTTTTTGDDGTKEETTTERTFTAGTSGRMISVSSQIATQSLVNGLYNAIKNLSFKSGNASFGMTPYLEAGDIITVDSLYGTYSHAINEVSMEIDGGCKVSITSAGKTGESSGGSSGVSGGGSVSQQLSAIKQDYGEYKTLVADNFKANTIYVKQLEAKSITTDNIESKAGYISNLVSENLEVDSINGNVIHNSHILAKALSDEAVETIMGNTVYYRSEAPENPSEGDLWYQTVKSDDDKTPTVMYEYRDGEWKPEPLDDDGNPLYASVIRANSITAQEIASNTITASQIKSGSITTDKLMIGEVGNLYDTIYDTFEGCYINSSDDQNVWLYKSSDLTASINTENAFYGTKCLKLERVTGESYSSIELGNNNHFETWMNVEPDTVYKLSFYVKSDNDTTIRFSLLPNTGNRGYGDNKTWLSWSNVELNSGDWDRKSFAYTTPSDVKSIRLRFAFISNNAGTVYVDAIQVEKGNTTPFKPASYTKIDGSCIQTKTIKADVVDVEDIFAQNIKATGTIDGATIITRDSDTPTTYIEQKNNSIDFHKQVDGNDVILGRILSTQGITTTIPWESYKIHDGIMIATSDDCAIQIGNFRKDGTYEKTLEILDNSFNSTTEDVYRVISHQYFYAPNIGTIKSNSGSIAIITEGIDEGTNNGASIVTSFPRGKWIVIASLGINGNNRGGSVSLRLSTGTTASGSIGTRVATPTENYTQLQTIGIFNLTKTTSIYAWATAHYKGTTSSTTAPRQGSISINAIRII